MSQSQIQPLTIGREIDPALYDAEIQRLFDLYFREIFWSNSATDSDITVSTTFATPIHREHIFCTNTGTTGITVTLNDGSASNEPFEDQQVIITRQGGGPVTIDAGNKTIFGQSSIVVGDVGTTWLKWSDLVDEWVVL